MHGLVKFEGKNVCVRELKLISVEDIPEPELLRIERIWIQELNESGVACDDLSVEVLDARGMIEKSTRSGVSVTSYLSSTLPKR